jgi:hypothetical protein
VVAVVGVVAVVSALGVVVVVDEDAPQPAATSASDAAVAQRIGSRLILFIDKARRPPNDSLPESPQKVKVILRDPDL